MRSRVLAVAIAALALAIAAQAFAEPQPGDACTAGQTNYTQQAGGPETSGVVHLLRCDGSTWKQLTTWLADGNVGIGTATAFSSTAKMQMVGAGTDNYRGLAVTNTIADATNKGSMAIVGPRKTNANVPFTGFGTWDNGLSRTLFVGGGGWSMPDPTDIEFHTAPSYSETTDTGVLRMLIDNNGTVRIMTTTGSGTLSKTGLYVDRTTVTTSNVTSYDKAGFFELIRFDIPAGITDSGDKLGIESSAYAEDADFAGTLNSSTGLWARAGINIASAGATINNAYGVYSEILSSQAGATIGNVYGVYINNGAGTSTINNNFGLYQSTAAAKNYFAGNVGIGTTNPKSALHVPDGKYAQIEDNNAGAPPAADCDNDDERGRQSIDTTNNRLYVCNGVSRGWDYVALTN
jgi:hypothetical protein